MEAVKMAVMAGIDISMVPQDYSFATYLIELVQEGEVPMERIDEAVTRVLKLKLKLGLFDNPYPEEEAKELFGNPQYEDVALQAARESITLLKNEASGSNGAGPVLPLSKNKRVFVTGPGAHSLSTLHGCWSYTWQGDNEYWYPESTNSIHQAIANKLGKKQVSTSYKEGFGKDEYYYFEVWAQQVGHHQPTEEKLELEIAKIKDRAKHVDYIILCLGEEAYAESPGVIDDLHLPDYQYRLAHAAADTGKPVILVLTEGRPRIIKSIEGRMHAIIMAYVPGSKGAEAIADVLFGDYNPSGKLPFTYPANPNDLMTYDFKYTEKVQELWPGFFTYNGYKPQWPFGYGLSYVEILYNDLKLENDDIKGDEPLKFSIKVTNTGKMPVNHSVDVFSRDLYASVTPSQRRLRAYQKVALDAGQTKTVKFSLSSQDLAFVNQQMQWVTEPGQFEIFIGTECALFCWSEQ
jgi:beta-glucosidase